MDAISETGSIWHKGPRQRPRPVPEFLREGDTHRPSFDDPSVSQYPFRDSRRVSEPEFSGQQPYSRLPRDSRRESDFRRTSGPELDARGQQQPRTSRDPRRGSEFEPFPGDPRFSRRPGRDHPRIREGQPGPSDRKLLSKTPLDARAYLVESPVGTKPEYQTPYPKDQANPDRRREPDQRREPGQRRGRDPDRRRESEQPREPDQRREPDQGREPGRRRDRRDPDQRREPDRKRERREPDQGTVPDQSREPYQRREPDQGLEGDQRETDYSRRRRRRRDPDSRRYEQEEDPPRATKRRDLNEEDERTVQFRDPDLQHRKRAPEAQSEREVDEASRIQYPDTGGLTQEDFSNIMNVDVVGRLRPQTRGEGLASLQIEASGRVAAQAGGPYFGFQTLHASNTNTYDVYKQSVESLLELFLAGYNVCLLVGGESGAGKSYTVAGESNNRAGIVQMVLDHLFAKLSEERYQPQTRMTKQDPQVTLQMLEVYNELVKDLLQMPNRASGGLVDITETPEKGTHAKNATTLRVSDASTATAQFRQGWGRRTESRTDHGPAEKNAAYIIHIDLTVKVGDNPQPYKSRFTIVELPGLEKLSADPAQVQLREGPQLSKALIALNQVTSALASHPFPDRVINYGDSKLTQLLQEELGGNFKTRALICLKPKSDPDISAAILRFCTNLSHIRNFPVVNDGLAQGLLTQKEAKILDLKQQSGVGPVHMTSTAPVYSDAQEEVRRLQTENLVLKDQNERLQLRLDRLQNKFGDVANTKTDLSQQLLLSEEEKLKVSQSLVDLQIENNKIREEAEATKFELTNKIILLENQVIELEAERDRHKKAGTYTKERLSEMEKDRKDLADEYVVLKTNFLALTKEHNKECTRNEELAIELLNLVNNKAALMRQVAILTNSNPGEVGDPNAEIDRVRAIVAKNSSGKIKADEILGTQRDREAVEQTLFASKRKHETELERLRRELGDDNKRMEGRLTGLMKELADTRNLARERQQKISELNAKLITVRGEKQAVDTQLNRLQHKVKDLGEDFRARLVKYVEDIAEYVDKGSNGHQSEVRLREYCDSMLKDIRRSHREREQQLSEAAQQFRSRLQNTIHKYEELLIAYRNLRQTCEARGFDAADLGPDEYELKLSESEIQSSHLREVDKVRAELAKAHNELDALKLRYGLFGEDKDTMAEITTAARSDIWGAMRKQMREFTLNTQQQLEQERARLLSENNVLKEQLRESQQYIDSHLVRYKQEIVRLRKMLGMSEDGVMLTDRGPKRYNRR